MLTNSPEITFAQAASDDFFTIVGMEAMADSEKQKLLEQMNETVIGRVYLDIYKRLSPKDQQTVDQISQGEVMGFLSERGFDLPEMVITDAVRYRLELATMYRLATQPLVALPQQS